MFACLPTGEDVDGVKVFTIAFGGDPDRDLLKKIAERTNGKTFTGTVDLSLVSRSEDDPPACDSGNPGATAWYRLNLAESARSYRIQDMGAYYRVFDGSGTALDGCVWGTRTFLFQPGEYYVVVERNNYGSATVSELMSEAQKLVLDLG